MRVVIVISFLIYCVTEQISQLEGRRESFDMNMLKLDKVIKNCIKKICGGV